MDCFDFINSAYVRPLDESSSFSPSPALLSHQFGYVDMGLSNKYDALLVKVQVNSWLLDVFGKAVGGLMKSGLCAYFDEGSW